MMRTSLLILAATLLTGCPKKPPTPAAAEQAQADTQPTADMLFEQTIETMGGRDNIEAMQSLVMSGKMEMPAMGIAMEMTRWQQAPDKASTVIVMPGVGEIREGFDGKTAWSMHPVTGPAIKSGAELAEERRNSDFYAALHYADHYPTREVVGSKEHAGEACWQVDVVTSDGQPRSLYFAVDDGMIMGSTGSVPTEMGAVPMVTTITEIKEFNGFPMASRTSVEVGAMQMVLVIDDLKIDVPATELPSFTPPAEVQALQAELDALPE